MKYKILINKYISKNNDKSYKLVKVASKYTKEKHLYLEKKTYKHLKKLLDLIEWKYHFKITITSGYVPPITQSYNYTKTYHLLGSVTEYLVEYPYHSEKVTGLSFELSFFDAETLKKMSSYTTYLLKEEEVYNYFLSQMAEYGFILRYPLHKEKKTNFFYHPYYFRYVGNIAKKINYLDMSLEEYLE